MVNHRDMLHVLTISVNLWEFPPPRVYKVLYFTLNDEDPVTCSHFRSHIQFNVDLVAGSRIEVNEECLC